MNIFPVRTNIFDSMTQLRHFIPPLLTVIPPGSGEIRIRQFETRFENCHGVVKYAKKCLFFQYIKKIKIIIKIHLLAVSSKHVPWFLEVLGYY